MAENFFDQFDRASAPPGSRAAAAPPPAAAGTGNFFDQFDGSAPGQAVRPGDPPPQNFDIDWSKPIPEVRAAIARLPTEQRQAALRQWADAYVANEREGRRNRGGVYGDLNAGSDAIRNVSRGTLVGSWLDEANALTQDVAHRVSGGRVAAPYAEAIEYERAQDRAIDKELGLGATATQVVGGLASGGPVIAGAKTLAGRVGRGSLMGALHGYVYGSGNAEGDLSERNEAGLQALPIGVALGGAIPVGIAGAGRVAGAVGDAVSPTLARWGTDIRGTARRWGINASADGAEPAAAPGARAAAEQVIANQLLRSNRSAHDLRTMLNEADEAARFHDPGRAQNVLAPVDLDPGLARLAGSAARQNTEAADMASTFMRARQTGQTPAGRPLEVDAGLPHRPALARPLTGAQAEKKFGTRFGTPEDDLVPMGQFERMRDALKRAMRIEDAGHHGHGVNAYRTEQAILAAAKKEADELYTVAYRAGQNVSIAPEIEGVIKRWALRATDEPRPVAAQITRAIRLFQSGQGSVVNNLERFDKAKQFLDGEIEKLFTSLEGRNRYLGGILTVFKNEMLEAVDKLPNVGSAYSAARGAFGSRMEMRDALELGRAVFRENSDIAADQFRALTKGQQNLFRLGLLDSFEQHMGRQKRTADVTQVFESPRIQGILEEIIERSKGKGDVFHHRPERFGRFVQNEQSMVSTRNVVTGGSQTQRNKIDDQSFDTLNSVVEQFRASPSIINIGLKFAETALNKLFGMRADTAASIARQLFTADPVARMTVLRNIEARMGPTRMAVFNQAMRQVAEEFATPIGTRQAVMQSDPR